MKYYIMVVAVLILFSSCLKQSIADAVLHSGPKEKPVTATLSYQQNGKLVSIKVTDADAQSLPYYRLGVEKNAGSYVLSALGDSSELVDVFNTDTLTAGNYDFNGTYGEMYFLSYNNQAAYVQDPADYFNLIITSNVNGHISGTFSGQLSPLIYSGGNANTYGTPGSVKTTNGVFQNVPYVY